MFGKLYGFLRPAMESMKKTRNQEKDEFLIVQ